MTCEDVDLLAAEAALGLVSGADRAGVLAHLEGCERCRSLVGEMAEVADALVVAAPQAEPPPGFEQRVLRGLGAPRRRWPVAVAGAAAAVALVVVFALGRSSGPAPAVREVTMRTPSGRVVGEAYVHPGSPTWVFAAVPGWKDDLTEYRLRVTLADGTSTEANGIGSWGTTVPDDGDVRSIALVGADGQVWCSAAI